jgi:hypothetical protein
MRLEVRVGTSSRAVRAFGNSQKPFRFQVSIFGEACRILIATGLAET